SLTHDFSSFVEEVFDFSPEQAHMLRKRLPKAHAEALGVLLAMALKTGMRVEFDPRPRRGSRAFLKAGFNCDEPPRPPGHRPGDEPGEGDYQCVVTVSWSVC